MHALSSVRIAVGNSAVEENMSDWPNEIDVLDGGAKDINSLYVSMLTSVHLESKRVTPLTVLVLI